MSGSTTILDFHDSTDDFEEVLALAEANAKEDGSTIFMDDMRRKYDTYGEEMFLTELQNDWILRLAEGRTR